MSAPPQQEFYEIAFSEAERGEFAEAQRVEGLRAEIAILRMRLRSAIAERPEDLELVERGVRLLVQSLLAQHRLTSREAANLTEAVTGAFEHFAGLMREAVE
jgi:hypothetical protein